jgi:DnaJ like chaperone protein
MGKFGKWVAGGLGWAFFGPVGGILGFVIGSAIDSSDRAFVKNAIPGATTTGDFAMSLLVLVAAVMKADGKVLKSELDYVKKYFVQSFGEDSAKEAIKMLGDLIKQKIDTRGVCMQIRSRLDHASRLQMMHFLFGIAMADGQMPESEQNVLRKIAAYLGISEKDTNSLMSMFVKSTDSAYKILEIEKNVSNEELKDAYRKMAKKYHPDKVSYLGEDFKKAANDKFQKVNEAYEQIKKERGIK